MPITESYTFICNNNPAHTETTSTDALPLNWSGGELKQRLEFEERTAAPVYCPACTAQLNLFGDAQ